MSGQNGHWIFARFLLFITTPTILVIMMMFIRPVVNNNDSIIWRATVATGNATDAGTNGKIYLTLKGTVNSSNIRMRSMNGVLFQRGQVDVFTIYTDYIGQLVELTIIHSEFSSTNTYLKWQLDYFLLLDLNTSTEYGFHYGNYIPENANSYGFVTLQPDTVRNLTNRTNVSSSVDPSVFSTQSLLSFDSTTIYSLDSSSVFSDIDTSIFISENSMTGLTSTMQTAFNVFSSILKPDSILLSTPSTPLPSSKAFSSLLESSPRKDASAMDILFPTSEVSFTIDAKALFTATSPPDSATLALTGILENEGRFSPDSTLCTTPIVSSYACLITEMASAEGDLSSRMISVSRELTVDKKQLSVYKRKKSSAPDDRNSAKAIGFVALLVLAFPVAYIILTDLSNYRKFLPRNELKRISTKEKQIENV